VTPRICDEDLVPSAAQAAVRAGGELLIEIGAGTSTTQALPLRQQYILSSWRTIEIRRGLLGTAVVGVTAFIGPTGKPVAELPVGTEGVLKVAAPLSNYITIYSVVGDWPWWAISAVGIFQGVC
jgi:apolipoprotein N-acyltransferase